MHIITLDFQKQTRVRQRLYAVLIVLGSMGYKLVLSSSTARALTSVWCLRIHAVSVGVSALSVRSTHARRSQITPTEPSRSARLLMCTLLLYL